MNGAALKALSKWPTKNYVNIWVVREIDDQGEYQSWSGGTLGYAYPVSSSATNNPNANPSSNTLDGIVAVYFAVGNLPTGTNSDYRLMFRLNRTLTHEMGHHLNLQHTFDGESCSESSCTTQGDFICDTPPTVLNNNCSAPACGGTQQVRNHMDYTNENCRNMFSEGQKTRMRAVLTGTSRASLAASDKCPAMFTLDAAIANVLKPDTSSCEKSLAPLVVIKNKGSVALTSFTINYNLDGGTNKVYNWTGNLNPSQTDTVQLASLTATTGNHTVNISLTAPNGSADENTADNTVSKATNVKTGTGVRISIIADCYASETSWELRNSANTLVGSGGPYTDNTEGTEYGASGCLANDCYTFKIFDKYGDGLSGTSEPDCGVDGDFYIYDDNGNELARMTNAKFGSQTSKSFCLAGDPNELVANFTATPATATVGQSIQFNSTSTGNPAPNTFSWNFGDGGSAATASPTHSYTTTGVKSVTLIVSNGADSDTVTKTVTVAATYAPCDTVTNALAADTLTFYGLGAGKGYFPGTNGFAFTAYADKFVTAAPVTLRRLRVPVARAQATGSNSTLNLSIYGDNAGVPGTRIGVQAVAIQSLTAGFYADITLTSPITVNGTFYIGFEVPATADTVVIYTVKNRPAGGANTVYIQSGGTWRDANAIFTSGMNTSLGIQAFINSPVKAAGSVSPTAVCTGSPVNFVSISSNADSVRWTFTGPVSSSTITQPNGTITFTKAGKYDVNLIALGQCGQRDTLKSVVNVYDVPTVDGNATPNPLDLATGNLVTFTSAGSANVSTFTWNFGGGLTKNGPTVTNTYTQTGSYTVILKGTNAGCNRNDTVKIQVINSTGIDELAAKAVSIYPNPASQHITVKTDLVLRSVLLINSVGQQVPVQSSENHREIELGPIAPGMYILRLETDSGIIHKTIQISK